MDPTSPMFRDHEPATVDRSGPAAERLGGVRPVDERTFSLTSSGRAVLVVAIIAVIIGWLIGLTESYVLAAAAGAALVVSTVRSVLVRPRLSVRRLVTPQRSSVGGVYEVTLEVRNGGRRRSAPVVVSETVGDTPHTTVAIAPLAPSEPIRISMTVPTDRRGHIRIGPTRYVLVDPFGLVERSTVACAAVDLLVHPRSWPIALERGTAGRTGSTGPPVPSHVSDAEEFSTLGEYVPGDDRRHIHWPSTARRGHLMVRRFESQEPRRTHVVLERFADNPGAFEATVSIVASMVTALHQRGDAVTFGTASVDRTGGEPVDPVFEIRTGSDLGAVLDRLAVVDPQLRIPSGPDGSGRRQLNHRVSTVVASVPARYWPVVDRLVVIGASTPGPADDPVPVLAGRLSTAAHIRWIRVPAAASITSMDRDRIESIVGRDSPRPGHVPSIFPTPSSFGPSEGILP